MTGFLLLAALLYILKITYKPDLDRWVAKTAAKRERVTELRDSGDVSADAVKPVLADLSEFADQYMRWLKNEWIVPRDVDGEKNRRLKNPPPGGTALDEAIFNVQNAVARVRGELEKNRVDLGELADALATLEKVGTETRNNPLLGSLRPIGAVRMSEMSGPRSSLAETELRRDEQGRPHLPAENTAYLGRSIFSDYLLSIELAGILLLVAAVGAIAITHHRGGPKAASPSPNGPPPGRTA
jgi:hypothetical protein